MLEKTFKTTKNRGLLGQGKLVIHIPIHRRIEPFLPYKLVLISSPSAAHAGGTWRGLRHTWYNYFKSSRMTLPVVKWAINRTKASIPFLYRT